MGLNPLRIGDLVPTLINQWTNSGTGLKSQSPPNRGSSSYDIVCSRCGVIKIRLNPLRIGDLVPTLTAKNLSDSSTYSSTY